MAVTLLILFLALVIYLKVPGMVAKSLDERSDKIREDLAEAKRLREEAQHLLAEYQRKRKDAEAEAASIVAAAEREAAHAGPASKYDGRATVDNDGLQIGNVAALDID